MKQSSDKLNSVEKALQLLLAFSDDRPVWGVRQLSGHLGFSPATVQRLLQTLKNHGFVLQTEDTRQYRLGNIYYRFLHTLQNSMPVTRTAVPYMQRILSTVKETVHLNVMEGNERVCVDTMESLQSLKASMPLGNRSPLYAGASSKCLLAFSPDDFREAYLNSVELKAVTANTIVDRKRLVLEIEKVRKEGYAKSLGERSPGLGSLSAPIFDHRGNLLAAMSLAIPEVRFRNRAHCDFCLENLLNVANALSAMMGRL